MLVLGFVSQLDIRLKENDIPGDGCIQLVSLVIHGIMLDAYGRLDVYGPFVLLLGIEVVPGQAYARLVLEVMPSLIVAVLNVQHLIQRVLCRRNDAYVVPVWESPCAIFSQLINTFATGVEALSVLVVRSQVERLGPCGQVEAVFRPCGVIVGLLRRIPVHVPVIGCCGLVVRIVVINSLEDIIIGLVPGSVQKYSQKVVQLVHS